MTVSSMELSQRDPSGAALGAGEALRQAQQRALSHLRHVVELVQLMMARGPPEIVAGAESKAEQA
eukprot:2186731-Rhodomonas_salina.1